MTISRDGGETLDLLSFSNYNYLGFAHHPQVKEAAKDAIDRYGLGAAASPAVGGSRMLHRQLEHAMLDYFGLPGRGVSLFAAGYAANTGTIQAFMKPGGRILIDRAAHISILEGAQLSRADISYFEHNDLAGLKTLLARHCDEWTRVLVCVEGVYSADGDEGALREIVGLAKEYGAFTLVDEAHSTLVAGPKGRGVSEAQGVLEDVDLYVMTFSKAFGGIGGALLARAPITRYVNWYARNRMFSCALDPAVTGGMIKVLELASGTEGDVRRKRIRANSEQLRQALAGKVEIGRTSSWIVPVFYGEDERTLEVNDGLQRLGVAASCLQFPAVSKREGRIRMFVTSEHTARQIDTAADAVVQAARRFGFALKGAEDR